MHIITEKGATVMLDGLPRMIPKTHPRWDAIVNQLRADNIDSVRRLLNPAATFVVGDSWRTRSGSTAVITSVVGDRIMAEVDECYEVLTTSGDVTPGVDNDDDLIERIEN